MNITTKPGTVTAFNDMSGRGEIDLGDRKIGFGITSFSSGWPVREPRIGDRVDVGFSGPEQQLLFVRIPRTRAMQEAMIAPS